MHDLRQEILHQGHVEGEPRDHRGKPSPYNESPRPGQTQREGVQGPRRRHGLFQGDEGGGGGADRS